MKAIEVQSPDLGYVNLVLNSTDDQGNSVSKTYKLIYDYRAIKRTEDELGIDLKDFTNWKEVKPSMTPKLIYCGLAKFHPDVTLDEITDQLSPSVQGVIQDAIFELLFPGFLEKIKKIQDEQSNAGEISPNAQAGVSVVA